MAMRTFSPSAKSRAPAPLGVDPRARPGSLSQAPLGGIRSEAFRRLQIGAIGMVAVLLLIGLASIIKDRATQSDKTAVAGAASTSAPVALPGVAPAGADPLAEAGVVPEMPASPAVSGAAGTATSSATPPPVAR